MVPIGVMNVRRMDVHPVVVPLIPPIEVHQNAIVDFVRDRSNANFTGFFQIISFQAHDDLEFVFVGLKMEEIMLGY